MEPAREALAPGGAAAGGQLRLTRLVCEHFAGVRRAAIAFGPGVNVLYGPNDLGKSSLVEAIRLVLLLPHTSSAHERYVSWGGQSTPHVSLTLALGPADLVRISKSFSRTRGQAALERATDGDDFTEVAHGREVDTALRELLRWGISPPAGRGGKRGVPESFLASVLLARQDEAAAVLRSSLRADGDESGKTRIAEALRTLSLDPRFVRARKTAEAKLSEAFTATGRRQRRAGTPFAELEARLQAAEAERQRLAQQVDESRGLLHAIGALGEERRRRESARDAAMRQLQGIERWFEDGQRRLPTQARLESARGRLADAEAARRAVARLERREQELAETVSRREAQVAALTEAMAGQRQQLEAARTHWDQVARGVQEARQERRQSLERAQAELSVRLRDADLLAERARARGEFERDLTRLEASREEETEAVRKAKRRLGRATRRLRDAEDDLRRLRTAAQLARVAEAAQQVAQAREAARRAEALEREADEASQAADAREREIARPGAPPGDGALEELRTLERELRIAEAKLAVGLSVQIEPAGSLPLTVTTDGAPPRELRLDGAHHQEARREVRLDLPGVGSFTIRGGDPESRIRAGVLRERWEREAQPILDAAGAATLGELTMQTNRARVERDRIEEMRREANRLRESATLLRERAGETAELDERLARAEREVAGIPRAEREALAPLLADAGQLPEALAQAETRRLECLERRDQAAAELADNEGLLRELSGRIEARRQAHAADEALLVERWEETLARARARSESLREERAAIARQIEELAASDEQTPERGTPASPVSDDPPAVVAARVEWAGAEARARESEAALDAARVRLAEDAAQLAECRGQLAERRRQVAAVDYEASCRLVEALEAELVHLPPPAKTVTAEEVEAARVALAEAESTLREVEKRLHQHRGALGQLGGAVAEERLAQQEEVLRLLRQHEQELELDYGAWQLLADALADAERESGDQLAHALAAPVTERFAELTGQRYDAIELDPALQTEGVIRAGGRRDTEHLSLGTQDQLATILRLSVAEQIGSAVLLDDQLVQSDPQRLGWFRALLRECAKRVQVIVVTCRPQDYLRAEELPRADEPATRDSDGGALRAIDLERLIERA